MFLLNLLNELGKSDRMRDLLSIISLFLNELHTFNNTGARMLDSIYHMTLKYFCNRVFGVKRLIFAMNTRRFYGIIS